MSSLISNWLLSSFKSSKLQARNTYPSFDEAQVQLIRLIDQWNNTAGRDGLSPNGRYERMGLNPSCVPLSERDRRFAFGHRTTLDVSYMRSYIRVRRAEKDYTYTVEEYTENIARINQMTGFAGHASVLVCSDERTADLYTQQGIYILSCPRTVLAHKSAAEATVESRAALRAQRMAKAKALEAGIRFSRAVEESRSVLMPYAVEAATSRGVVKDHYNQGEEDAFNEQLEQAPVKALTAAERGRLEAY